MKVYIAASWLRRMEAKGLAGALKCHGITVVSQWHGLPSGVVAGGRYVQEAAMMRRGAVEDMEQLQEAEALVVLTGDPPGRATRGGRHTEMGLALAWAKAIYLVGPREQVFHWHPDVMVFDTQRELVVELARQMAPAPVVRKRY